MMMPLKDLTLMNNSPSDEPPAILGGQTLTHDEIQSWLWHKQAVASIGAVEADCISWANEKILKAREND